LKEIKQYSTKNSKKRKQIQIHRSLYDAREKQKSIIIGRIVLVLFTRVKIKPIQKKNTRAFLKI